MKLNKTNIFLVVICAALIAFPVFAGPPMVAPIGGSGTGDVTGPESSTDGYIVLWDGVGGDTVKDSTHNPATLVVGPGSATDGYIALFDGVTGKLLKDGIDPSALLDTSDVDDVPVDSATTAPVSSNWAYDHENAADPHSVYMLESEMGDVVTHDASEFEPADAAIAKKDEANTFDLLQTFTSGFATGRSATPTITFKDLNCTDEDDNARIQANATDTGSGTEDVDLSLAVQIGGVMTNAIVIDADGDVSVPVHDLAIGDGKGVKLDDTPGTDDTGTGEIASMSVTENSTGVGCPLHMHTDGSWIEADADTASAADMPCEALALETSTGTKKVLLRGFIRNDDWAWTVGGLIYVSGTTGTLTQTAPATTGAMVQVVGFATHADRMYFNPSYNMVEYVE